LGVGDDQLPDAALISLVLYGLGLGDPERVSLLLGLREPDDGVLEVEVRWLYVADLSGASLPALGYLLQLLGPCALNKVETATV
jgi:hypothetical protein